MRALVKQLLDNQISRRRFMKELTALGVSISSAASILNFFVTDAEAAEGDEATAVREVTGNGADMIVETLKEAGVKYIFNGCGAGINRFFDAIVMHKDVQNYLATNEGQCVAMAEGYHIASGGELGVVIIPKAGLGNAAGNIYNALVNRSSILILTARESSKISGRQGDLEAVEWEEMMAPFMKWRYRLNNIERIPEMTRRAIKVAMSPPGGPTFLQMNEDLYEQEGTGKIIPQKKFSVSSSVRPQPELITEAAKLLIEAKNPLITVGGEITKAHGSETAIELSDLLAIPVSQGWSGFADFPNRHPMFLGRHTAFLPFNREADLYVSIGSQMPDPGSYVHGGGAPRNAKVIHISLEMDQLASFQETDVSVLADVKQGMTDLIEAVKSIATNDRIKSIKDERYGRIAAIHEANEKRRIDQAQRNWDKAPMTMARISSELNDQLDETAIIVSEPVFGAHDWFDYGPGKKSLISVAGPMILGWGTGAALGAKLAKPDSQVVAISGDGAFMFQHSLWSLSRYDAPVLIVVYNNHAYNITRAFQWRGNMAKQKLDLLNYLGDPDVNFTHIAKAYGIDGEVVNDPSDLSSAITRGLQATKDGRPYLLDVQYERWGPGGDIDWHPEYSIASMRSRNI